MPTTPPTLDAAPAAPVRKEKATFGDRIDAFNNWLSAAVAKFGALAANVYANAVETFNNANTASTAATTATDAAAAATATANATLWVSGQSVAQYANKISPLDHQTYRRKTATGSGTTDPSLDPTNYALISLGANGMQLLATATVSSPVANIDFLNVFTASFSKYVVEIEACSPSASNANLLFRLAVGGTVDVSANYRDTGIGSQTSSPNGANGTITTGSPAAINATATLRNALDPTGWKFLDVIAGMLDLSTSPSTVVFNQRGNAYFGGKPSGIRLYFAGTTFSSGTIRIYGIRANL